MMMLISGPQAEKGTAVGVTAQVATADTHALSLKFR